MKDGFIELNSECKGQQFIMFPYLGGNGVYSGDIEPSARGFRATLTDE